VTSSVYSVLELLPIRPEDFKDLATGEEAAGDLAVLKADPELADVVEEWTRDVGSTFERAVDNGRIGAPPTRRVTVTFLDKPTTFDVRLGLGLLEDLILAYGAYGCAGLDAVAINLTKDERSRDDPVEQFIARTHRTVTQLVLIGLERIERQAITFAQNRWTQAFEQLEGYKRLVREPRDGDRNLRQFHDPWLALDAVAACKVYAEKLSVVKSWDEELKSNPTSKGSDPKSPFHPLWTKAVEGKAAALQELSRAIIKVTAVERALALALDKVGTDFGDDQVVAAGQLAHEVYVRSEALISDTKKLLAGLRSGPRVMAAVGAATRPSGQLDVLVNGGLEAVLVGALSSGDGQQLLLNADLLRDLTDARAPDSPFKQPSWERFVLRVHRRDVKAEAEKRAARDARFRTIRDWLVRVVAGLAIIAFLATFPFSEALGAAAAPALLALLNLAGTLAGALGLAMLAVETGLALLVERGEASETLQARLYQLGAADPMTLAAIGGLLGHRSRIVEGVLVQILQTALTMSAARIKVLEKLLDVYGSFDDMEALFAPAPSSDESGSGRR
jgi:hypothetical protein